MGVREYIVRHPVVLCVCACVRLIVLGLIPSPNTRRACRRRKWRPHARGPGMPSGALEFSGLRSLSSLGRGEHFFLQRTSNYRRLTASFANNAAGLFGVLNVVAACCSVRVNLCACIHARTQLSHALFIWHGTRHSAG